MNTQPHIVTDHEIMLGKPVIRGTCITVELVQRKMVQGVSVADLLDMYPHLTVEDGQACLDYAADLAANEAKERANLVGSHAKRVRADAYIGGEQANLVREHTYPVEGRATVVEKRLFCEEAGLPGEGCLRGSLN